MEVRILPACDGIDTRHTNDVYLPFLLVGHTHEDINQRFFAVISSLSSLDGF